MTAEKAIKILRGGVEETTVLHNPDDIDEACRMACEALRLYSSLFQQTYSLNAAIAEPCRNNGLPLARLDELAVADKAGRLVILPDEGYADKDGEEALRRAMWDCNYKNNGVTRFAADAIAEKLCCEAQKVRMSVKTPLGDIVAEPSTDPENPGIWVWLHQPEKDYEPALALVEYTKDEADRRRPALITRVWGDAEQDEYTDRVVHTGLREGGAADEH